MRADFSLDYDVLTMEQPQKIYLMARFAAKLETVERSRRPLNISLVMDRSGSMAGAKIDYTRQAAQFLVQHLGPKDVFSIVLYNDKVETLFGPDVIRHKDQVSHLIDGIRVHGTTNLSGGWLDGCRHVAAHLNREAMNRVILMSDGLANRGVTDTQQLILLAQQKREEGVTTTTMGLGEDFNEDLMIAMANAGGGSYYFIESPEMTPAIFREELTGLLNVVGQNLTITLDPTSHVTMVKQLNAYPLSTSGNTLTYNMGDMFTDEVKGLVLELSIPALATVGECKIATLRFEYDDVGDSRNAHQISQMDVIVNVKTRSLPPPPPNPEVEKSVLLLQAAQARQEAVKAADQGDYMGASQRLRTVADSIDQAHVHHEQLDEERRSLLTQAEKMEQGTQAYDEYSRKTMSTQAYYTMTSRHDDTIMLRFREIQRKLGEKGAAESASSAIPGVPLLKQPGVPPTHVVWNDTIYMLKGDLMRFGRASHNEIVVTQKGVSRFHCQIRREGDKLLLEDLGSTNGTMLEGTRLNSPHALSVGDVVYLCDEKFVFTRQD